jgi:hypothetical protein
MMSEPTETTGTKDTLIWSDQHRAYWNEFGAGYTLDPKQAGRWTRDDAARLTCTCGPEKKIVLKGGYL